MLSIKQREMLISFHRDGEASDFADFVGRAPSALAWGNRERVIDALRRKGLLDDDGITQAGRDLIAGRQVDTDEMTESQFAAFARS